MGWIQSIVLGIVQGLTEFLPVSSSGHLVVVPAVLGWKQPSLTFDLVLHSPMTRARDTCEEAGLIAHAEEEPRLSEWNYGIYEGRKTVDIQADEPGWSVWTSPIPQGESLQDIQARAESLIERLLGASGRIALFSHAHFLRVLGACWMADSAALGAHLLLDTASVSVLGFDRESRALRQWNVTHRPA